MENAETWSGTEASSVASSARGARPTLSDLSRMRGDELAALYAGGTVPESLRGLEGRPRGRMLAVSRLDGPPAFERLRRFAGAAAFPWGGKSFSAKSAREGRGINRVRLGALRYDWFPFDTRIERSRVDARDAVILDYDKAENPIFIRHIHDEIREVAPSLWLGPAMWKHGGKVTHVLWFALDFEDQERGV